MQTSAFGAFLDVAVDCISRGTLYAWAINGPASALLIALEFLTFCATHKAAFLPLRCCACLHQIVTGCTAMAMCT